MTSLPLYWPEGAGVAELANGTAETPWQREFISECYTIRPLDTLSAIPALSPDEPEVDPLEGVEFLAVIQPRGLSPVDNVALDGWVRGGGKLLLVLDPLLTGEYLAPLGDPARPVDEALTPPAVERWGLIRFFDEDQSGDVAHVELSTGLVPMVLGGKLEVSGGGQGGDKCELHSSGAVARCAIGDGTVILFQDAAVFEHPELAGENGAAIHALLRFAFD